MTKQHTQTHNKREVREALRAIRVKNGAKVLGSRNPRKKQSYFNYRLDVVTQRTR